MCQRIHRQQNLKENMFNLSVSTAPADLQAQWWPNSDPVYMYTVKPLILDTP